MTHPSQDGQPAASSPPLPTVSVTLEESETITTYGSTTVSYLVLFERTWLAASRVPGAIVEQLPRVPRVVWRRQITLQLAPNTPVERLTERPERRPATAADVLLGRSKGLTRQTQRRTFRVGPKGELRAQ